MLSLGVVSGVTRMRHMLRMVWRVVLRVPVTVEMVTVAMMVRGWW